MNRHHRLIMQHGGIIGAHGVVIPLPLDFANVQAVVQAAQRLGFDLISGNVAARLGGAVKVLVITTHEGQEAWLARLDRGTPSPTPDAEPTPDAAL
jgi:hypothetical protein